MLLLVGLSRGAGAGLLPGVWCVRGLQLLPRPFHKNIKRLLLLQPSLSARAGQTLLYPFVSAKAHSKVAHLSHILHIGSATEGEVQLSHLGEAFLKALQAAEEAAAGQRAAAARRVL